LTIEGYGQLAYQNGGGNITSSIDAPQKWIDSQRLRTRVTDLEHMRTARAAAQEQRLSSSPAAQNMKGIVSTQSLDGDVAFNINAGGAATRAPARGRAPAGWKSLAHPVVFVHMAMNPKSAVANPRKSGGLELVDVTSPLGDALTLALHPSSSLPAWVSWGRPRRKSRRRHLSRGVHRLRARERRADANGIQHDDRFPIDRAEQTLCRSTGHRRHVRKTSRPAGGACGTGARAASPTIEATSIAKGIWFLRGAGNSVLFEFDDHLTLFEVYASEANAKAVIDKARSLVPGKPLTEAIVSHHHFDHTGGLRTAVAEGLTIVMQRGNEAFIREVTSRPAKLFPDALGRTPKPLKFRAVDDHLKMADKSMDIDIYRVVANTHMADGLMVYVPRERLLAQGDLFDINWEVYWWGSSYMDNVKFRNLQVDRDVPVHGRILPIAEVQQAIAKQIANAQALCASVDAAGLSMRGCPVKTTVDR
jgi:glyoxylase-like metal-dependent hydrolase (beta-lactamase superfamily II)